MQNTTLSVVFLIAISSMGCDEPAAQANEEPVDQPADEQPAADIDYRWLPDDDAEKFAAIEDQLGGFSATMEEVSYRYTELYWAGQDRNWDYAQYQLEKIESSIEDGIIRRPGRAESARQYFLDDEVPALADAIEQQDGDSYDEQFEQFTAACNTCHVQEDVEFIQVTFPEYRTAPVAPQPGAE